MQIEGFEMFEKHLLQLYGYDEYEFVSKIMYSRDRISVLVRTLLR